MKVLLLQFLGILFFINFFRSDALVGHAKFVVKEAPYTRLCSSKKILTVNGQFPGPTLYAERGDTIIVDVHNYGTQNITIHWHGVKQPRNPWSDGPEFITQCPIQPGAKFSQKIVLSDEEGTLWWHAHSDWSRATVHGAIVIYPKYGTNYPFPKPDKEVPIILDTFKLTVDYGKTYLLRMINAGMSNSFFFAINNHTLTVVGTDAAYSKPLQSNYITISPGQTLDILLEANQPLDHYYMAARVFNGLGNAPFQTTTTTAVLEYRGNYTPSSPPSLPNLPNFNDTNASLNFTSSLRSLATNDHPINVPLNISTKFSFTLSINTLPCAYNSCQGPRNSQLAASVNNISLVLPKIDILEAYYRNISNVYGENFPRVPPSKFNYMADFLPLELRRPMQGTKVMVLEFNSTVELVYQGTNLVSGVQHPMHLHGYSFYVVGWGIGNFNKENDPMKYNLFDPPLMNTITVPRNGWTAIRFKADNPGVWLMHCHFERHVNRGMGMTFIVENGKHSGEKIQPPPPDMPPC